MGLLRVKDEGLWQQVRREVSGGDGEDGISSLVPNIIGGITQKSPPGGPPAPPSPPGGKPPQISIPPTSSTSTTEQATTSTSVTVITSTSISSSLSTTTSLASTTTFSSSTFSTTTSSTSSTSSISSFQSVLSASSISSISSIPDSSSFSYLSTTSTLLPSSTSTEDQQGVAFMTSVSSLIPAASVQTSPIAAPSSAAQSISDTPQRNYGGGFYVGIGVAIGTGVALIFCLVCFLYKLRRSRLKPRANGVQTHYHYHTKGPPLSPIPSPSSENQVHSHFHHYQEPRLRTLPNIIIPENSYPTPGPPVPEKSINGDIEKGRIEHPDGLGIDPAVGGPSSMMNTHLRVRESQNFGTKEKAPAPTPMTVSTGILKVSSFTATFQNTNTSKTRAVSEPIGPDIAKFTIEKEQERELERARMGKDWETAKKRGTGAPLGSEAGSLDSTPRWRDPVQWVRDQRARMMGRARL